jgi:ribose transport system ATP-binding protein
VQLSRDGGETPRLAMTGIAKSYGHVVALDGADLVLRPGEILALLGENGAGKSTLVKVLSGLVVPDRGTVEVDGIVVDVSDPAKSSGAGVAVVQQEFSVVPSMTVAENLALGQPDAPRWWFRSSLSGRARSVLERVGLSDVDPGTPVEQLSVAERQLVEIARVLVNDARIIVFDEPTAALSDVEIEKVLGVVQQLAAEGRGVIYVTHRLNEVIRIADRITVVRDGHTLPAMDVAGLEVSDIVEAMLGRKLGAMYPERRPPQDDVPSVRITDVIAEGMARPVSLELARGEIFGVTGQLGSGADTFVRALAGLGARAQGSLQVDGHVVPLQRRAQGIRGGVAYVSADRKTDGIFAGLPIQANLSSPWLRRIRTTGWLRRGLEGRLCAEYAREFGLAKARLSTPVGRLSGGNQQKAVLGKWLGARPRLLLVEEPTRGVDVGARAEIYERLQALCATGTSIVVFSSEHSEVLGLCHRVGAFYRGALTAVRPAQDWTSHSLALEVMHAEVVA